MEWQRGPCRWLGMCIREISWVESVGIPGLRIETWGTQRLWHFDPFETDLVVVVEAFEAEERGAGAQLFFNAEKLVVLGDAVGAAH